MKFSYCSITHVSPLYIQTPGLRTVRFPSCGFYCVTFQVPVLALLIMAGAAISVCSNLGDMCAHAPLAWYAVLMERHATKVSTT